MWATRNLIENGGRAANQFRHDDFFVINRNRERNYRFWNDFGGSHCESASSQRFSRTAIRDVPRNFCGNGSHFTKADRALLIALLLVSNPVFPLFFFIGIALRIKRSGTSGKPQ